MKPVLEPVRTMAQPSSGEVCPPPQEQPLSEKAVRLKALFDSWLSDDSGYDEEAWPELKAALDRDRLSYRRLFDD